MAKRSRGEVDPCCGANPRLASQPKRPSRRHISGLIGGLDEISGRFLDQIRRVIYLVEKLHDEIVNPQNPFGPVKFGAFLVSNDQLTELHGDDGSSMCGDVPANSLSETLFSRDRHMAGSHTQMAYSMPFWTPVRLKAAMLDREWWRRFPEGRDE